MISLLVRRSAIIFAMKYWAWKLQGTILREKVAEESKDKQFLNPWTSLSPDFLKGRLAPDFLAVLDRQKWQLSREIDLDKTQFPFWALVFPRRSYLPPAYPHLQLWLLSRKFSPSLSAVGQESYPAIIKSADLIDRSLDCLAKGFPTYQDCQKAVAINATPFSFIRDENGRYCAGGQSVRAFHLHFLMMPKRLEKIEIKADQAPLVYPTSFSLKLLNLVLNQQGMGKKIFNSPEIVFRLTERGISFGLLGEFEQLFAVLNKIDEIFYSLQLSLIFVFYQDSEQFLGELKELISSDDPGKVIKDLDHLVLLGKERSLSEIKELLAKEIVRLGKRFELNFPKEEIAAVCQSLTLAENGDLASWLGKMKAVLRPGMGYGCFAKIYPGRFEVHLSPLDSLLPEGMMESTGFFFTEKIEVDQKPEWLKDFLDCFKSLKDF